MKDYRQKNKTRIFKNIGWFVVGIFFAIIVPIVINRLYETPAPYPIFIMSWEAKDALSFYGSLLGAVATVFALVSTIKFTVNNQKEERKLSIKPYLQTRKYRYTEIQEIPNDKVVYLTINKGGITYYENIPKDINNLKVKHLKMKNNQYVSDKARTSIDGKVDEYFKKNLVMLYEIENNGAGNAIDVEIKISDMQLIQKCSITTKVPKQFVFIISGTLLTYGAYPITVSITYSDVASLGRYYQEENFSFDRNDLNRLQIVQNEDDLLTVPKEINK